MDILTLCFSVLAIAGSGQDQGTDNPARAVVQATIVDATRYARIVKGPMLFDTESFQKGFREIGAVGSPESELLMLATRPSRNASRSQAVMVNNRRASTIVDDGLFIQLQSLQTEDGVVKARVFFAWTSPPPPTISASNWNAGIDHNVVEIVLARSDNEWKVLKRSVVSQY